jgi:hypothetical protein
METSTDTLDLLFLSSSPSTHKVHSHNLSPTSETRVFDLDNPSHDLRLKQWCRIHWPATIKKSLDNYNPVTYHDCCFCFSRRGFTRKWDHPEEESHPITKISTLKEVNSEEEFHSWLRNKMQERQKAGKTLVFPSVNSPHLQAPHQREDCLSSPKATDFLRKRCFELSHEKMEVLSQVDKLKADNARLHASSKSWFDKYQEAIKSREESVECTPVKRRINMTNEELLFLD